MNIPNSVPDAGSEFIQLGFLHEETAPTSQKYQGERLRCGQIVGSSLEKKVPRARTLLQRNNISWQKLEGLQETNKAPDIHQAAGQEHADKGHKNAMALTENVLKKH